MATLNDVLFMIQTLSAEDKGKLKDFISNSITSNENNLNHFIAEKRSASGIFCPHCKESHIKRNGHYNGVQRYLCLGCKKTFNITTNTIVASSKKDISVWNKYIECMMSGLTIRKSAAICGIDKDTAFIWRHKILDALQNMAESVKLDGIIEGDETFFPISYKGNHNKSAFVMPREAHHRGKQTHVRGLSHEKVCVPCAVNRNGLSIAKVSNLGKVSEKNLHNVFDERIIKNSILCTDGLNSYVNFAAANNIELIQLKSGKSKKGIYHIQHINSYHSMLKNFIARFKGVSTKYLNNYLIWNNILNYSKETWTEKKNIFETFVLTTDKKILSKNIPVRPALPLLG